MSDFKKLLAWQKGHALAMNVHRAARRMRATHHKSLRSQMVRAAMSISTNLVEGCGQQSRREFGRFIRIALNSASELEYHLIVASEINAITRTDFDALTSQTVEVRTMLHGLLNRVMVSPRMAEQKGES